MTITSNLLKNEPAGQLQEVPLPSRESQQDSQLAPDWLDAFILAHSELEFENFFLRLRKLDAWRDLLANLEALQSFTIPLTYQIDWRREPFVHASTNSVPKDDKEGDVVARNKEGKE